MLLTQNCYIIQENPGCFFFWLRLSNRNCYLKGLTVTQRLVACIIGPFTLKSWFLQVLAGGFRPYSIEFFSSTRTDCCIENRPARTQRLGFKMFAGVVAAEVQYFHLACGRSIRLQCSHLTFMQLKCGGALH
jgi:hypothetical protein